ncbi:hypothetical protein BU23DRAFT_494530 [Bimuria novae-zelandiae CBS 107.79]|uniref:DUF8212 domain-containing protein n=1 Tax=Bimuria novae-zelandiae CBS 107.79 TaxID=1447943 RepID=A0A6A5UM24_9PLEO|nr:hypothetical protein BU23DRAFT_494530 [Bimuria novae-zelandiae CBS 107.79]
MSWASRRETTKIEDLAYCLMGIFGVNMPLLYGEGERAYARLQGEIMKRTYDHSLFAWNYNFPTTAYGSSNRLLERPPQGIGVLAPHPSAFSGCADIIPYTTKTEPYVTTNRGIQIHLRVLRHSLSAKPHTRLAILQCRYRSNLSTAMAIPIKPVYRSRHLESEVEYYRSADEDLVNLEYSLAAESSSQNIYLHEAEPFWQSEPQNLYRCCLHKYGKELGVQFHKALYCQYPIVTSTVTGSIVKQWNYKDNSAIWGDDRRGIRAALYFAKSNGPAFVVVLTLMHLSTKRGYPSMHIYIRTVHEKIEGPKSTVLSQVSLRKVLEEETPFELAQELDEIQTTFPFESRVMTVQVKREIIHEEIVFILDIFFSGVKRSHSESNRTP